jgi:hypothetical protein
VPIADRLRHLARRWLGNVWRVSELAEATVHAVWYRYGEDLGFWPTSRLWHHAKWNVEDLRVGGWRARQSVEEPLPEDQIALDLDAIIQQAEKAAMSALMPGGQWDYERRLFHDALIGRMKMRGDIQAGETVEMICDDPGFQCSATAGPNPRRRGSAQLGQQTRFVSVGRYT